MAEDTSQGKYFPYKTKRRAYGAGLAGLTTALLAVASITFAWKYPKCSALQKALTVAWGTVPPSWFLFEHYRWFDNWDNTKAADRFREGRALWAKLWAGVGAILATLLFKHF